MAGLEKFYFEDKDEYICGIKVPTILDDYTENYPSIVDRFFTRYYHRNQYRPGEEFIVLLHSNGVCLICLAPSHIALTKGITSITFNIGNADRSQNQVKGKGKKGGMILQSDTILAILTTADGSTYKVPSCVRGKLVEVNDRVIQNPSLLSQEGDGYVAIVLPKPEHIPEIKKTLLAEEEHCKSEN